MAAVFGIGLIVALFILFLVIGDGEYDDDYSSSSKSETSYQHESFWGVPGGKTNVKNGKMEHTDFFGVPTGYSEKNGDRIQHKTWYGDYNGYSTQKGNRIEHYTDFGVYKGYSEKHSDGTVSHHDIFGTETSRSKKN